MGRKFANGKLDEPLACGGVKMKEILSEYGQSAIAVFIAIAVLTFFSFGIENHNGAAYALHTWIGAHSINVDSTVKEGEVFEDYASSGIVQIVYANPSLQEKKTYSLSQLLVADTQETGALCLYLLAVVDMNGNRILGKSIKPNPPIKFEKPGIYTIYFAVADEAGKTTYGMLQIPVQRGRV